MVFVIFYSIVLSVYALVNYYIFVRGMQGIPADHFLRGIFPYVFWSLAATYVVGRTLERVYLSVFSDVLVWIGSFWLAAMLYFFMAVVLLDFLRLIHHFVPFFPSIVTGNYEKVRFGIFAFLVVAVVVTLVAGFINARNPAVRQVDVTIDKQANGLQGVHAVLLSDIHLGTLIGNGHFSRIVDKVEALNPDIILLAGDVLDEDLEPVLRQNIGQTLSRLSAPMGVYAVMGNHEYIGGAEPAYEYLKKHGLQIIRDSVVKIEDSFYLIGREDRDKPRFSGKERLPLDKLVAMANPEYPLILMDHQPYYLKEAARLGVDLQVSGHTHHGQLWPLNYVTSAIYTISSGYGKVEGMHAYVSNGVGTWGPPVRVGNRPEIVQLNIRFGGSD